MLLFQGVGTLCGRLVHTFHCSSLTVPTAIAMTMRGLVGDGSWVCLGDAHRLTTPTLSVLSQMMSTVRRALLTRQSTCSFIAGSEVWLNVAYVPCCSTQ